MSQQRVSSSTNPQNPPQIVNQQQQQTQGQGQVQKKPSGIEAFSQMIKQQLNGIEEKEAHALAREKEDLLLQVQDTMKPLIKAIIASNAKRIKLEVKNLRDPALLVAIYHIFTHAIKPLSMFHTLESKSKQSADQAHQLWSFFRAADLKEYVRQVEYENVSPHDIDKCLCYLGLLLPEENDFRSILRQFDAISSFYLPRAFLRDIEMCDALLGIISALWNVAADIIHPPPPPASTPLRASSPPILTSGPGPSDPVRSPSLRNLVSDVGYPSRDVVSSKKPESSTLQESNVSIRRSVLKSDDIPAPRLKDMSSEPLHSSFMPVALPAPSSSVADPKDRDLRLFAAPGGDDGVLVQHKKKIKKDKDKEKKDKDKDKDASKPMKKKKKLTGEGKPLHPKKHAASGPLSITETLPGGTIQDGDDQSLHNYYPSESTTPPMDSLSLNEEDGRSIYSVSDEIPSRPLETSLGDNLELHPNSPSAVLESAPVIPIQEGKVNLHKPPSSPVEEKLHPLTGSSASHEKSMSEEQHHPHQTHHSPHHIHRPHAQMPIESLPPPLSSSPRQILPIPPLFKEEVLSGGFTFPQSSSPKLSNFVTSAPPEGNPIPVNTEIEVDLEISEPSSSFPVSKNEDLLDSNRSHLVADFTPSSPKNGDPNLFNSGTLNSTDAPRLMTLPNGDSAPPVPSHEINDPSNQNLELSNINVAPTHVQDSEQRNLLADLDLPSIPEIKLVQIPQLRSVASARKAIDSTDRKHRRAHDLNHGNGSPVGSPRSVRSLTLRSVDADDHISSPSSLTEPLPAAINPSDNLLPESNDLKAHEIPSLPLSSPPISSEPHPERQESAPLLIATPEMPLPSNLSPPGSINKKKFESPIIDFDEISAPDPQDVIEIDEIFENQRRLLLSKEFSAKNLLPTDRPAWSNHRGDVEKNPASYSGPLGWEYVDPDWTVDQSYPNTDQEGWQYAVGFFGSFQSARGTGLVVRRRRWVRQMKKSTRVAVKGLLNEPHGFKALAHRQYGGDQYQFGDLSRTVGSWLGRKVKSIKSHFSAPKEEELPTGEEHSDDLDGFEKIMDDKVQGELDEHTKLVLLSGITVLPEETSLDAQGGVCASCSALIPVLDPSNPQEYARKCYFDGKWYCTECHRSDFHSVPSLILHRADVNTYPVSMKNYDFLCLMDSEPLYSLQSFAVPGPTDHKLRALLARMTDLCELRKILILCKELVLSCPNLDKTSFRKLLWPREYLWDNSTFFSNKDLMEIGVATLKYGIEDKLGEQISAIIQATRQHLGSCPTCQAHSNAPLIAKSS